ATAPLTRERGVGCGRRCYRKPTDGREGSEMRARRGLPGIEREGPGQAGRVVVDTDAGADARVVEPGVGRPDVIPKIGKEALEVMAAGRDRDPTFNPIR